MYFFLFRKHIIYTVLIVYVCVCVCVSDTGDVSIRHRVYTHTQNNIYFNVNDCDGVDVSTFYNELQVAVIILVKFEKLIFNV